MSLHRPFHPSSRDLPQLLPVFPLAGTLLLPGGRLPLNIFEPRYLAMVQDALGWGRLIGMIQPLDPQDKSQTPTLYEVGCAGRISAFSETEDGRLLVTLTGVCRFRIRQEVEGARGYRRIVANWSEFEQDLDEPEPDLRLDRPRLLAVLRSFAKLYNMEVDWKALEGATDLSLLTSLPMAFPFDPREKQALLECADSTLRAHTLIALMEMALAEKSGSPFLRQ